MEEKKVRVVLELDKECIQSSLFWMGEKLSDDIWEKLISKDVVVSTDELGEKKAQIQLAFSCLAFAQVLGE